MKCRRFAALGAALLLTAGCGAGSPEEGEPQALTQEKLEEAWEEAAEMIDQQLEQTARADAARFPCSLFAQEEVEALMGNALEPAAYTFEHVTEDDFSYRTESCRWSSFADDANEIGLKVSRVEHFDSGSIECPPPANADTGPYAPQSIANLGDAAWWDYAKSWGTGTLLACSSSARVKVEVDLAADDQDAALAAAAEMAGRALAGV